MSKFQEITERYQERMRQHHADHMRRIAEIEREASRKSLILIAAVVFFFAAPIVGAFIGAFLRGVP